MDEITEGAIRPRTEDVLEQFLKIIIFGNCAGKESTVKNEKELPVMLDKTHKNVLH